MALNGKDQAIHEIILFTGVSETTLRGLTGVQLATLSAALKDMMMSVSRYVMGAENASVIRDLAIDPTPLRMGLVKAEPQTLTPMYCPFCLSVGCVVLQVSAFTFRVRCDKCHASSSVRFSADGAVRAWNKRGL